jgi:hypothetical protein
MWVPDADRARLDAYRTATRDYHALESELFVVNDTLRVAGTLDRLWLCPDGAVRVGDLKSGKWEALYPLSTATQIATYARSVRYDPETGTRAPLHEALDDRTGLLVHLPATGGCEVIPLDLERGWQAAQLAATVHHDVRRWTAGDLIRGGAA